MPKTRPRTRINIEERFTLAQIAIGNTLADPTLQTTLAAYGYTADRLQQGNALRERARALYERQKSEYGELFAANDALEATQQQAQSTYMCYVKVARVALKNDRGALQKLDLATQRKGSLAGWLAQAHQFYINALSDVPILGKLAEFGITQAMLEAGQRQVDAVGEHELARRQRRGAARDATRVRDETIAALDSWMKDFTKIARLAFQDRPQFLEKLGIKARRARATTHAPGSAARSVVTFAVEASTLIHDSDQPTPERRNGRATINSR
jgi:hypothetical protein